MNPEPAIKVWDIFVRVFHWSLVLTFFIAYFTEDDLMTLHTIAGYSVLALISIRLLWGFIGSQHARFKDFLYPLSTTKKYLQTIMSGKALRYIGHNPAGGLMIVVLLITLFAVSITGIMLYGADNAGPFASIFNNSSKMFKDILEETHDFFANFTLFLIAIHLAGVLIESLIHKENLVKAMITGFKKK